jgi:DNA-binding MarR family transcriptional regulator
MATQLKKKAKTKKKKLDAAEITREFDAEGVRRAMLAALECIYENFPHITLAQYLVALEILVAEMDGKPHTLVSLVKKLNMPFSTASRVVWSLTAEGGNVGIVKYEPHPTDRRMKYLVIDPQGLTSDVPRALNRAMLDYYGDSVHKLKRAMH